MPAALCIYILDRSLKGAAILSFAGATAFLVLFVAFLFLGAPEDDPIGHAVEMFKYSFDPEQEHSREFYGYITQMLVCVVCGFMFWFRKTPPIAMALVVANTAFSLVFSGWAIFAFCATPLVCIREVINDA